MLRGDSWAPLSPQEALQLLDPRFWASVGIDGADSSGNPLDTSEQDSIDPIRLEPEALAIRLTLYREWLRHLWRWGAMLLLPVKLPGGMGPFGKEGSLLPNSQFA